MLTPQQRETHARSLVAEVGGTLDWQPRRSNRYSLPNGVEGSVTCTAIRLLAPSWNQLAYLSVLHEVGHLACGHTGPDGVTSRYFRNRVGCEAEAWEWAVEHVDEPLEAATIAWILSNEALQSYTGVPPTTCPDSTVQALCTRLADGGQPCHSRPDSPSPDSTPRRPAAQLTLCTAGS